MSSATTTINEAGLGDQKHAQGAKTAAKLRALSKRQLATTAAIVAALATSYLGYHSYVYVSTDNASIEAKATFLSARVGGLIVSADAEENQSVKAGQVLAKIRPIEYQNALDQAEADRASLVAQVKNAELSYRRGESLFKQGAMTQERRDAAEADFRSLAQKVKSADTRVEQAKINLADTEIKAPTAGKIARKSFEVGMMANPGQPLLGFVAGGERWATANFKETEMKGVTAGKHAEVSVDAIAGRTFTGIVESISPSTGATFSLLPPDNATGNFTKVVQRVPVRVKLVDLSDEDIELLQTGLSAEVTVKLH